MPLKGLDFFPKHWRAMEDIRGRREAVPRPEVGPGHQTEPRGGRRLCQKPEEQEEGEDPTGFRAEALETDD